MPTCGKTEHYRRMVGHPSEDHLRGSTSVLVHCLCLESVLKSDIRRSHDVAGAAEVTERKQSVVIDDECRGAEVGGDDTLRVELVQDQDHLGKDEDRLLSDESAVRFDLLGQSTGEGALE